jgi:hypothetical protein
MVKSVSRFRMTIRLSLLACAVVVLAAGCGFKRYTNIELLKKSQAAFPREYEEIIEPLDSALMPIRKQIFFIKNDVKEMKDKLWDCGTNQRVVRIDNNIDIVKKEVSALSAIRREILNTIYYIYPAYEEPELLLYIGENKKYKEIKKRIMIITLQDQREYLDARSSCEKMSQTVVYKPLIRFAMEQFNSLPDSLRPKARPIGSPGPVRKIEPYAPPKAP